MEKIELRGPNGKLRVLKIVKESFSYVVAHRKQLAAPWMLLFFVGLSSSAFQRWVLLSNVNSVLPVFFARLIQLSGNLPVIVLHAAFMVGLLESLYLDRGYSGFAFFRFDRSLLRCLMVILKLFLSYLAVSVVLVVLTVPLIAFGGGNQKAVLGLLLVASIFGPFVVCTRLALAVPAAGLGDQDRLLTSWRATRGNTVRILGGVFIVCLPSLAVGIPLTLTLLASVGKHVPIASSFGFHANAVNLLLWCCSAALGAITAMTGTVMLSLIYGLLARGPQLDTLSSPPQSAV